MRSIQYQNAKKALSGRAIALVTLGCLLQPIANAQSDAEIPEAVRICQRVPELSSRLACYDRAYPPVIESADRDNSRTPRAERPATAAPPAHEERVATAAEPAQEQRTAAAPQPVRPAPAVTPAAPTREERAAAAEATESESARREDTATSAGRESPSATTARIVEILMPRLDTTIFRAADGRVFVRESTRSIRWPEPPFDVQIDHSLFGSSTYLVFPQNGLRVRVALR